MNDSPTADKDAPGDCTRGLREFVDSIPRVLAWVHEQAKANVCPGCGNECGSVCFPGVTSMWCGIKRRHIVPPETSVLTSVEKDTP